VKRKRQSGKPKAKVTAFSLIEQSDRDLDCKIPGALKETPLFTLDEETEQV
jgi:hypothetical protein